MRCFLPRNTIRFPPRDPMTRDHAAKNAPPPGSPADIRGLIAHLMAIPHVARNVAHVHSIPARPPRHAEFPDGMAPGLVEALRSRGITRLYSHQAAAIRTALDGQDVVVVTPTASGKTMCFNVPVLQRIAEKPDARALYLFPTKALAQDQYVELHELARAAGGRIKTYTYDGDTPASARKSIRAAGSIILTNPDMLHTGIMPGHTGWIKLFENLEFVVIDEVHHYRGIFGSHVANVLRRLDRLCRFYGSKPSFICCSATIANPGEIAEHLTGRKFAVVDENGAPAGQKTFLVVNPPVVNEELGIRRGVVNEVRRLAARTLAAEAQTIVFARSRLRVEILVNYLRKTMRKLHKNPERIAGYRGGYLPNERRAIEQGVKSGAVLGVVSTNALELGIDIGQLRVAIIAGYPGSVASTWQQAGRAGRKAEESLAVLVASSSPLDQYMVTHPDFLFGRAPESAIVDPDNVQVLASHIKCALFELPFDDAEQFGAVNPLPVLQHLEEIRMARHTGGRWHWSSDVYPSEQVSLRTANPENFVVVNVADGNRVMGEVDYDSAPFLIHTEAIYMHLGETHFIENLDWDRRTAYARPQRVDYYTDALSKTDIRVLQVDLTGEPGGGAEDDASAEPSGTGLPRERLARDEEYPLDREPDAGPAASRDLPPSGPEEVARRMEAGRPQGADRVTCGRGRHPDPTLPRLTDIVISRNFGEVLVSTLIAKYKKIRFETHENVGYGEVSIPPLEMQTEAYWLTFRSDLHDRMERHNLDLGGALAGLGTLLAQVAPLYILCDPRDIRCVPVVKSTHDDLPAVYLYDRYPCGIGLSRKLFEMDTKVLLAARDVVTECVCQDGCPGCVGPDVELDSRSKRGALVLLEAILGG